MNIIEKIKALNLPLGEYVVLGGGVLEVLNLRKASDIDIAVTPILHAQLRKTGEWGEIEKYQTIFLRKDNFDVFCKLHWDKQPITVDQAISDALIIDGIPFMNLKHLCQFKTSMGRGKDFKDIDLINNYLEKL